MAKKIRFPLEMDQGVEVRSMEELRENFSLSRVLTYLSNGKLVIWLRNRYADDIANAIEDLNTEDKDLPKKVCDIFEIEYDEEVAMDLEKAEERGRKLCILKEYTTEQKFLDLVDVVAFTQDDVYDLLDEEEKTIYLCGERFLIPLSKKGMTYIGVNNPVVVIESKKIVDWEEKEIILSNVRYDDKYQEIIENTSARKQELSDELKEKKATSNISMGGYLKNSYINFMLSVEDKQASEHYYNTLVNEINSINYDIDANVSKVKQQLKNLGLGGLAKNYIESL